MSDYYKALKECLTDSELLTDDITDLLDLSAKLPTDLTILSQIGAAAGVLASNTRVTETASITADGKTNIVFPPGSRGVFTARGDFGGATLAIGHKESVGATPIAFRDPIVPANPLTRTIPFSFEFVMPTGGIIEVDTSSATGSTAIEIGVISIQD